MSRSAKILLILLAAGLLCFGALEGAVLAGCHDEVTHDADVVIVLGAKLWPDGPSPALKRRLDKALDYVSTHPNAEIIVSGGQGHDEYTSEAQAMADYLLERGCAPEHIHLEDKATSTAENLRFSMAVMRSLGYDPAETPVAVVSNNFHLTRTRLLCRRLGLTADTLGAPMPDLKSAFYSYNREAFALLKDLLFH